MTDLIRIPADDLAQASPEQLASYAKYLITEAERDGNWSVWLRLMWPHLFTFGFAPHHEVMWEWLWGLTPGVKPDSLVIGYPRKGAKSTNAEAGVAQAGCRQRRRFALYVSETQDQADKHVLSIAGLLESPMVALCYPDMATAKVSKVTGMRRSWARQRLTTAGGFTVEGFGLDVSIRGIKLEDVIPDLIVLDDVDSVDDSLATVDRKIDKITTSVLPTGAPDAAVLGAQNVIHAHSIFARLLGVQATDCPPAEFLSNRQTVGPIPAIEGLEVTQRTRDDGSHRYEITAGTATWEGQSVPVCQGLIDEWGITAFMREAQHETTPPPGGVFSHLTYQRTRDDEASVLDRCVRKVVAVDPAVSNTDRSDSHAVSVQGIDSSGVIYMVRSWEQRASPEEAIRKAYTWAIACGAELVIIESDQGGDAWLSVFNQAWEQLIADDGHPEITEATVRPRMEPRKAASSQQSKEGRAQELLADYERPGRIIHVEGYHLALEAALYRFGRTKPFDLVDATVWGWRELRGRQDRGVDVGRAQGQTLPGHNWGASRRGFN